MRRAGALSRSPSASPRKASNIRSVAFADWNFWSSIGAFGMLASPLIMAAILWHSLRRGAPATARVWEGAKGLEWTVPSPAPHHTFTVPPVIKDGDLAHGDVTH